MITCKVSVNVLDRGEALWNMQQKGSVTMCVRQCARVTYTVGALCISVTVSVCGCVR